MQLKPGRTGRNEACGCGSGKKYKKCCGRPDAISVAPLAEPAPPNVLAMVRLLWSARYAEFETQIRAALAIHPDLPVLWRLLARGVYEQHRDPLEALQTAARLLLENPEAHTNLGAVLRTRGRLARAHESVGSVLRELGGLEEAEASLERARALEPDCAEIRTRLASVQRLLGRVAQSEANIQCALELDPGYVPAAIEQAELATDRGEFEIAESLYREAFARDSSSAAAWAGIVDTRRMTVADAVWLTQAEQLAARRPHDEVRLRFAMGKYLDDIGEYDRAFASYRQANELVKTNRVPHDRRRLSERFESVRQRYDAAWIDCARVRAPIERRPIFVVGMLRSGTSLAEQILASHPAVFGAGELSFWESRSRRVAAAGGECGPAPAPLESLAAEYDALFTTLAADQRYVVDKMPLNFMHLGVIHAALPTARIIHMRRHPIDTCLSVYFQNLSAEHSYANDLNDIAHYHDEYRRLMSHWRTVLSPDAMLEVPYEALVAQPELWSRRMVEFAGLPWDEACLDFHLSRRTVYTCSRWQVRQRINTASVERWRRYAAHVGPLLRLDPALSETASGNRVHGLHRA
ncbi:MAG TPA: sulfotransferase [Steroidobacteraceae bacterium]|nr:sulfotransferase [Steroidobacteraceae bacterium]